jgi:hypothetical protein
MKIIGTILLIFAVVWVFQNIHVDLLFALALVPILAFADLIWHKDRN